MRSKDSDYQRGKTGSGGKNCRFLTKSQGLKMKQSSVFGIACSLIVILFMLLLSDICVSEERSEVQFINKPVNIADIASSRQGMALQSVKKGTDDTEVSDDTNEFYRVDGRKISLVRSLDKIAIRSGSGQSISIMNSFNSIGQQNGSFVVEREIPKFGITVLKTSEKQSLNQLAASIGLFSEIPGVESAVPVYINAESGLEQIPNGQFIVKLADGTSLAELNTINDTMGVSLIRGINGTNDQFILEIPNCTAEKLLDTCEAYCQNPAIAWAEPDFISQYESFSYTPNDPRFGEQWYLNKMGIPQAWDVTTGSDQIIIAVLDNGFDMQHEDLSANVSINENEIAGDGEDNDKNGYIDDINGWDFYNDDNDPSPDTEDDNHGTACAGLAAAVGDNNLGIAGCAFNCKFMPIVVAKQTYTISKMAEAIYYASGFTPDRERWRGADVLSMSFGISESTTISDALTVAATQGRGGKGCPIFCASGNEASGYLVKVSPYITGAPNGRWSWVLSYEKDGSVSQGDDTMWIGYFINADGAVTCFDSLTIPAGWNLRPFSDYGYPGWYIEDDPSHAYGTARYQIRTDNIGNNQEAFLRAPEFNVTNGEIPYIVFLYWPSCEMFDTLNLYLYNYSNPTVIYGPFDYAYGGIVDTDPSVKYPAKHPHTIAVGSSTDVDYRADYSCYGSELDFVAPSGGGMEGVITTDRTGAEGYSSGKYYEYFGGTSASAPLAAGFGALLLSMDPNMTATDVRNTMRDSCDKIGKVDYQNGTNNYYGYGRLYAARPFGQASGQTIEVQVTAGEDDGYAWSSTGQSLTLSSMKTGAQAGSTPPFYMSAMRFANVDIPQGATIINAYLKICAYDSEISSDLYGELKAEDADDAASFSDARRMGSVTTTTASVNWDHTSAWTMNSWLTSPDISSVISEVTSRSGWNPGNSLVIVYGARNTSGSARRISTFDRGADYAAKLEITYVH